MVPVIERLLILQAHDKSLSQVEADLQRIPAEIDLAKTRLSSSQQAVTDAKAALQENEVAINAVELDIETRKNTIGRLKTQQFETRKNEEFRALGTEVERYQTEIDDLETNELELMEKADSLRLTLQEAQEKLAIAQGSVDEDIQALTARQKANETEIEQIREKRARAAEKVEDEDLLDLYDRLRKTRGNTVVVNLTQDGLCEGCHVKVTPTTLLKVQADKEVVQCENCGRILYPGS
ncbi:MAG: C4-type zinc ribbon domain-containing protein [Verrucomicrobiota bacterium]